MCGWVWVCVCVWRRKVKVFIQTFCSLLVQSLLSVSQLSIWSLKKEKKRKEPNTKQQHTQKRKLFGANSCVGGVSVGAFSEGERWHCPQTHLYSLGEEGGSIGLPTICTVWKPSCHLHCTCSWCKSSSLDLAPRVCFWLAASCWGVFFNVFFVFV